MHSYHAFVEFNRTSLIIDSENFCDPSKKDLELKGTNIWLVISMAVVNHNENMSNHTPRKTTAS